MAGAMLVAMLAGAAQAAEPQAPAAGVGLGPKVDQPGKLPDNAAVPADKAYDKRVVASFAASLNFAGPLQGGWTLSSGRKGDLYEFQITESGAELGGAWRDLKRGRDPEASGVLEAVQRRPEGLVLRFTPPGAETVAVTVEPDAHGMLVQGRRREPVMLRKIAP
jgi:hypothetical protein